MGRAPGRELEKGEGVRKEVRRERWKRGGKGEGREKRGRKGLSRIFLDNNVGNPKSEFHAFGPIHSQTHVYRWLQDCNEVRLVDCGPKTADDDVLQTPKPTRHSSDRYDGAMPCKHRKT